MTVSRDTRAVVLQVLATIAPEIDPADISDDEPIREQVDLDSMDWLRFLLGIDKRLGISIPESEYGSLRTLTDVICYLDARGAQEANSRAQPGTNG